MAVKGVPRARVLIVDDDRFHRELARDALPADLAVECCENADEALEALGREPGDIVVSDLNMPGLSGLELLELVKRDHPRTDFVMVTASSSLDSAIEALRKGATDYLRKPIVPEELGLVVERVLARRRLLRENVRLRDSLETVDACRALASCLEPNEVYSVALDLLLQGLDRPRGLAVYHRASMPSSDGAELRGFSEHETSSLRAGLSEAKPLPLDDIREAEILHSGPLHDSLREAGIDCQRVLTVPLRGEEAEVGLLCIPEDGDPFDEASLERVGIVADQAAVALRNAERYHQAKERAFIDDVTEVYNARYLLEAMDREIRRADRYGTEISVVFLDLDRFKLVNDQHGHLVGSQALRQLSQLLAQCVRQVDTLARYGGDEFTIVLVDTGEAECLQIAERIRRSVEETAFETGPGQHMKLTVSVGIATHPAHGRTRETLLEAADKAMYRAKSNGRNRVCSASELT